jgi:sugar phosphate isomerase/epimerase
MKKITRKEFINRSAVALAGASLFAPNWLQASTEKRAKDIGLIGFQSWIVRDLIGNDFPGTMKMMADTGYQSVEMCSPPGYVSSGFGTLIKLKATEMKKIINDAGLSCVSCHYGFKELKENIEDRLDFAKELELEQMVISSFGLSKDAKLDDWKKAADEANQLGELSKTHGMPMVFHNHNTEFEKLEGQLIYDVLLERMDPALVKMQFQLWVMIAGYKAADYFRKYPGRFISAHLYDWAGLGDEQVAVGKGKTDWNDFFKAAKIGGVKNTFVEMKMPLLKESAEFLKKVKV